MKAFVRIVKNEKVFAAFLVLLFIVNSALFFRVTAQEYTQSAGAGNLFSINPAETSTTNTSQLSGIAGNIINQYSNIIGGGLYSEAVGQCNAAGSDCNTVAEIQSVRAMYSGDTPRFNVVDAVAGLNSSVLQQRPASGVDYLQGRIYALTSFGSVSAQTNNSTPDDQGITSRTAFYSPGGTGFDLLRPIQNFWSWAVRIVYGFMLIIVIILAFAIMFRQKLSGGVEITVQNAIPAIVMAFILVPLSYAISGLFIDGITIGTNAVHAFLIGTPGSPGNVIYETSGDPENLYTPRVGTNPIGETAPDRGFYPDDVRVDWLRARDSINVTETFGELGRDVGEASGLNGNQIFLAVGRIVNAITGREDNATEFTWVGDIVQFFLSILTLYIAVLIFIALVKKYITLILYPVLSPFVFATVAIPGNGTKSIMQYAKVMGAAALAYIVTYAMFLLSIIFTSQEFLNTIPTFASASFNPPLLGLRSIGFGSNELTELLFTLIGLGIYFSIPSTLKSIDSALGADQPLPKFISTPIDAFNDSRRVMFKTAPAVGARLAKSGVSLTRNTLSLPTRTGSALLDLRDRIQGKTPGDVGTYRYNQRQRLAAAYASSQKKYEEAMAKGNYVEAARLKASMSATNALGSMYGTGVGTPAELKDLEPKLNVKFTWKKNNSPDNTILFTKEEVLKYISLGSGFTLDIGELELEAENLKLPISGNVELGELGTSTSTRLDEYTFQSLGYQLEGQVLASGTFTAHHDIFGMNTVTPAIGGRLVAVIDPGSSLKTVTELTPDTANKKYKVKVALVIDNVAQFFGGIVPPPAGATTAEPIIGGGAISGNKDFKTKPRLFKVVQNGATSSRPLSIVIKIQ